MRADYQAEVDLQCAAWTDIRCNECGAGGSLISNQEKLQKISIELYRRDWERILMSLNYAVNDLREYSKKSQMIADVTRILIFRYDQLIARIEESVDVDYVSEGEELDELLKEIEKRIGRVDDWP